jgi:hypothetical protein
LTNATELRPNETARLEATERLWDTTPLTQPYWLREDHPTGLFHVSDPSLIGRPENPPAFPVEYVFEISGRTLVLPTEPVVREKEGVRRFDVIPPVSLRFLSEVRLFVPGAQKSVEVELTPYRAGASGTLQLDAPAGWKVSPASQKFTCGAVGEQKRCTFTVTAPGKPATADFTARVEVNGRQFSNQRIEIRYPHIPPQLLQPPAREKAVTLDLAIHGKKVGYVPGAGDSVAEAIAEMGYTVTKLSGADLTPERLRDFDAVVIGVRAFNVRNDLADRTAALFEFVENGGNLIVQYNRPDNKLDKLGPFELRVSNDRVTDETAPATFLQPDHPALTTPNKITAADFDGWVQERGIYFPSRWDERLTPVLAFNDPGESPMKGSLLVAHHGKGYFVYTGLVWFRQLPAGVPGAYRLFANLVSLGK